MKTIGLIVIFTVSVTIGIRKIVSLRILNKSTKQIIIFLNQLKSNLEFSLQTPQELFETTILPFTFEIRDKTLAFIGDGNDFASALSLAVNISNNYYADDKKLIEQLGSFLGMFDKETQIKRLELMINEFDALRTKRDKQSTDKEKLYLACSVSFGLGLIIIFI